jgi:hypothetical protein
MGQQGDFSETHGLGKAVTETAGQIGIAAYNSDEQNDQGDQKQSRVKFVISKEMFILVGIALCKIVLWCLYRSAREDGLDVTNL